jgi:leader peptidase (prepilin peptidase) / N-methyltransferase
LRESGGSRPVLHPFESRRLSSQAVESGIRSFSPARQRQHWLATLIAAALAAATVAARGADANGLCWGAAQVLLVALASEDLRSRRLPNAIIAPAAATAIVLRLLFARSELGEVVIAGAATFGLFLVLAIAVRGGLGMGDVKLAGLLGLLLGTAVVPALVVGTLAGGIASAAIFARSRSRGQTIAYGPYLCLGGSVAILALNVPMLV